MTGDGSVVKIGHIPDEVLAGLYRRADAFVFPSLAEGFGLPVVEAMACGVPVAAYPVQGPVDIIENGRSGFVDENLRSAAVGAMYISPESCRARALEFSWDRVGQQFFENLVPIRAARRAAVFQSASND